LSFNVVHILAPITYQEVIYIELKLYNSPIKIVSETKCLGLLFDNKLTFLPHIKMLKNKSLKALNIFKFVSSTDWGVDSTVILIGELYNFNSGSGWSPHLLQKCIPRVFELENLNPFSIAHFSILFRHSCNCNLTYSDIQEQEMGVPQGSILSVTLFSIKINSFAKILNDNIEGSLYVDDFLICYRGKNMNNIERQLHLLFLNVRIG
jgi:hypothetical protein